MRLGRLAKDAILFTAALALLAVPSDASAGTVISDDDSSAGLLAAHIESSAGAAGEYDRYSRKLAKTLALLSPEQQARVFGPVQVGSDGSIGGGESLGGSSGGESDGGGSGEGSQYSEEEIANMAAFEEFLTGGSEAGWDGTSEPWWWDIFQGIFEAWLEEMQSGDGGFSGGGFGGFGG